VGPAEDPVDADVDRRRDRAELVLGTFGHHFEHDLAAILVHPAGELAAALAAGAEAALDVAVD
jgi:hypothetical protein